MPNRLLPFLILLLSLLLTAFSASAITRETFSWDARGRLHALTERDAGNSGYNWTATYDGFCRRLSTTSALVTNGVAFTSLPTTINSYYDPQVEFLELGVAYGKTTEFKLYGPDLNGKYGGMNGTGGFDAVSPYLNQFNPAISDFRGNILGEVTNDVVNWFAARPTGYGAVSGYRPLALGSSGASVALSSAWRGRWVDITGYHQIGLRPYDPVSGRWLTYDSVWNERDPNYYSFAGGDPVNGFDADGRCVEAGANYLYNGGVAGQVLRGVGGYLDSYNNSSAGGGYLTGAAGTIVDELAGISATSTYVNGLASYGNNVSTIYNDSGVIPAASYAVSGWNVGQVVSGAENLNLVTGEPVGDAYQRWTAVSSGVASTAGVASGGVSLFNWATAPAATTAVPSVIDSTPPATPRAGPLPPGEDPYQLTLFPDTAYNRVAQYGRTPTAAQRASVPPGMEFDHDPTLVQHYYEGSGDGTLPGFNMTQTERLQYGATLDSGSAATPAAQRAQGGAAAQYSNQQKIQWGLK